MHQESTSITIRVRIHTDEKSHLYESCQPLTGCKHPHLLYMQLLPCRYEGHAHRCLDPLASALAAHWKRWCV